MNASNYMYFNRMGCAVPEQTLRGPFGAQAAPCRREMRCDMPPAGIRPWLEPSQVQMTGIQPEQAQMAGTQPEQAQMTGIRPEQAQAAKAPRPWTAGFQSGQVQMTGIQPPQQQAAEAQQQPTAMPDPQMRSFAAQPSQMEGMCLGMGERMCPEPGGDAGGLLRGRGYAVLRPGGAVSGRNGVCSDAEMAVHLLYGRRIPARNHFPGA